MDEDDLFDVFGASAPTTSHSALKGLSGQEEHASSHSHSHSHGHGKKRGVEAADGLGSNGDLAPSQGTVQADASTLESSGGKKKRKKHKKKKKKNGDLDASATKDELERPVNQLNGFSRSTSPTEVEPVSNGLDDGQIRDAANIPLPASPSLSRASTPEEQQPVVADTFETEASRKVVASSGLQGKATSDEGTSEQITLSHQVRHQVALPPSLPYVPINQHKPVDPPARTWPFTLDPFQRVSIHSIERNESVLVSAHTSAGKTVVAEYAIAQSLRDKQRVIYTSPIKALSNQKYRELLKEFGDVGLMTGDVTINPSASCIVMTTEILRSMLYRGSEIMREVAWVIFDEIHYMRDKERGVVWEETIILLPRKVHYVFLSATIPNAMQFAEWVCKTKEQPCHVVYTDFRPTPLQHYLFPAGGDGIHLVVDEKGVFREDNFQKAMSALLDAGGDDPASPIARGKKGETKKGGPKGTSDIYKIVKMIMLKKYNPVIVFAFSKRECEKLALQMSKMDFNEEEEHTMVGLIFENAIRQLTDDDRQLPQIAHIQPLLKRGIGIHHSGLLPILKEVIEILFQEGLIKVLFATETFSIGLNMPARTVVFTTVRKFDGKEFRTLSGGEYIQMSGRAGRRGLDDRGIVIMMMDEKMEPQVAKNMVKGEADALNSAFHLGYNMILNLIRVEGISPEYMLERCFYQFQSSTSLPVLERSQREAQRRFAQMKIENEDAVAEYYDLEQQLNTLTTDRKDVICHPTYSLPFMQSGRLVKIKDETNDYGWGVVVSHYKRTPPKGKSIDASLSDPGQAAKAWIVDVLLDCLKGERPVGNMSKPLVLPRPAKKGQPSEMLVVPVLLSTIDTIMNVRLNLPKDLKSLDARESARSSLRQVLTRFGGDVKHLDPVKDMGIRDEKFQTLLRKIDLVEARLQEHDMNHNPEMQTSLREYKKKMDVRREITEIGSKIHEAQSVIQLDELKNRKRVLRRLGFATQDDVIEIKGRVACEISSGDELLLTELIFSGAFSDLTVEQTVALCSCFVFDEKSEVPAKLKDELSGPLRTMQESARAIARVARECKIQLIEEEYVQSFKPELMDVFYAWAKGAPFSQVCKMTDVFEGSLIRCFRRAEELLRSLSEAASVMGNEELSKKFAQGIEVIKRDVVFAGSLYL